MLPFPGHGGEQVPGGVRRWFGSGPWPGRDGLGRQAKGQKRGFRIPFRYARITENYGQQMRYWVRAAHGATRIECRKASRKAAGRDRQPIFDN